MRFKVGDVLKRKDNDRHCRYSIVSEITYINHTECYRLISELEQESVVYIELIHDTYEFTGLNAHTNNIKFDLEDSEIQFETCQHEWITYHGFTDTYEYCNKCDKKRNEV